MTPKSHRLRKKEKKGGKGNVFGSRGNTKGFWEEGTGWGEREHARFTNSINRRWLPLCLGFLQFASIFVSLLFLNPQPTQPPVPLSEGHGNFSFPLGVFSKWKNESRTLFTPFTRSQHFCPFSHPSNPQPRFFIQFGGKWGNYGGGEIAKLRKAGETGKPRGLGIGDFLGKWVFPTNGKRAAPLFFKFHFEWHCDCLRVCTISIRVRIICSFPRTIPLLLTIGRANTIAWKMKSDDIGFTAQLFLNFPCFPPQICATTFSDFCLGGFEEGGSSLKNADRY